MKGLISGLLDYSRVGSRGQAFLEVQAEDSVKEALGNLAASLTEQQANVEVGRLPRVIADAHQLTKLFQNLISNALKFRGPERPHIVITGEETAGDWLFTVRDNGIGIAMEHAERIFQIFQRLHTRREYPGTGVGLAICRRIVSRHGGRIWIESTPGGGSAFHFSLPKEKTRAARASGYAMGHEDEKKEMDISLKCEKNRWVG
jgi:light-regulated signal transduction histidine kinase (bacteriophytochrome)